MERPPETFGERVKRLAEARGLTNRAIAAETGAHEVTVSYWMGGRVPESRFLFKLLEVLGVTYSELFQGLSTRTGLPLDAGQERPVRPVKRSKRKGG